MATVDAVPAGARRASRRGWPPTRRRPPGSTWTVRWPARSATCACAFQGRLRGGTIVDLTDGDDPSAQIRLSLTGDDLLALVAGSLNFAGAWASGRVSVKAAFGDLLKLRKLL